MSNSKARDRSSKIFQYNSFLNTLDCALASRDAAKDTLQSHYQDLLSFVRKLSPEERVEIQKANEDWGFERRQDLQERCRAAGLI
mmetsp:Transcript_48787/g.126628  ORF Transcript_48787/g.126628 Transcript_48787/m.126628 type:complete len:85 (+) Transcript_48787:150-404(+)